MHVHWLAVHVSGLHTTIQRQPYYPLNARTCSTLLWPASAASRSKNRFVSGKLLRSAPPYANNILMQKCSTAYQQHFGTRMQVQELSLHHHLRTSQPKGEYQLKRRYHLHYCEAFRPLLQGSHSALVLRLRCCGNLASEGAGSLLLQQFSLVRGCRTC